MASSSGPALNEELQCSICLDVFTDPVTTPCGHNFCKTCLIKCWTNTQTCSCPLCKETFSKRPDLKINTTLREVVQHFQEKPDPGGSEVFCDVCDERKQKAVKTCLTCPSSYCETHLKPHLSVPRLKKHKLINPVENLEDYICQKHEKPLELFCRDDQTCVCLFCTEGEHKTHNTVPIEEESREKKNQLVQTQIDVHQMIRDRMKKIQEIQNSVELRKRNTEKEKSSSIEIFTDLIRSIERCQSEQLKMMEEQQKAAEKQAEDLIKEINQEITELKRRNTELEQLSHTDDHLHLIQIYQSICSPSTKKWTEINIGSKMNEHTLNKALSQLKETLDDKLRRTVLKRLRQYGVVVIPDHDTVNPNLSLPDYGQGIQYDEFKIDYPDNPKRFDTCPCVLGEEGYNSGRFYYEVNVKKCVEWDFGVARESINRKGQITLCPENGFWTMIQRGGQYIACEDPQVIVFFQKERPGIVGVFVDYEEGLVSFYNVESSAHIYSFTGQTFTDKLYPFFGHNDKDRKSPMWIYDPYIYVD